MNYIGIDRGFEVVLGFLYDVNPTTMEVSLHQFEEYVNQNDDLYKGLSILHLTCVFDQDHIMKHFLRFGIGLILKYAGSKSKQTLMHICAWYGTYNIMNLLIRNGVSVEERNNKGFTPIHLATIQGHFVCVQALLKAGVNPNDIDSNGNTCLHSAVIANQIECAEELFKFKAVSNFTPIPRTMPSERFAHNL